MSLHPTSVLLNIIELARSFQMSMLASSLHRLDLVPPSLSQNQSPNENEKLSPALENAYAHVLAIYQVWIRGFYIYSQTIFNAFPGICCKVSSFDF